MQQKKRTRRSNTSEPEPRLMESIHNGMNYFHEINFPRFKVRKSHIIKSLHSQTLIQESAIHETLQENKFKLDRLKTQVNTMRDLEFNDYIKKSVRYQELLDINDHKKKHLPTMNTKVGEVIKKSVAEAFPKSILYSLSAITIIKVEGWKPESRQGHSLIIHKDQAVLIGGHCSAPFSTINIYSFFHNSWVRQIYCDSARSYHSTIIYKNRFAVIFGGMGVYNKSRKSRDCFSSMFFIDLANYSTRTIKMHNEESVEPRRCHSATLFGRYMFVFGGINSKKEYLNDFLYLDLKELRWYHKEYRVEGKQLEDYLEHGIAKHAAISTFKARKNYSFYSSEYTDFEAIYFFGGFNGQQQSNVVFQLVLNRFVPTFKKVDYSGNYPSSISPVLEWYNDNAILIVSGDMAEREVRLFKIRERMFVFVNHLSSIYSLGGVGSSLNMYSGEYYMFFGLGQNGYRSDITRFSINEEVKEGQSKKKKRQMGHHDLFRETAQFSDSTYSGPNQ